jgi:SAM-dependent methyltransferase
MDLAFRDETKAEVGFLIAAFRKYSQCPVTRLLEPGCGGGRLVTAMTARGYDLVGIDQSRPALAYARKRLEKRRLKAELIHGDMSSFRLEHAVDAAFCTFNTFRHLTTEQAARAHLLCVADHLQVGGIYILGLHLLPLDIAEEACERWSARQGSTRLSVTLRVVATDRRKRLERLRISLFAQSPRHERRVRSEFALRMYTARQFRRLLATVPSLELAAVHDFWYEIDRPLRLSDELTDTVFILRKRRPLKCRPGKRLVGCNCGRLRHSPIRSARSK